VKGPAHQPATTGQSQIRKRKWQLRQLLVNKLAASGRVTKHSTIYARDPAIRAAAINRANGRCEFCGGLGFTATDGSNYLECHHIIALANDGADRMANVIALCANHHREAHFGERRGEIEKQMIQIVAKQNRSFAHSIRKELP
jgi:predicted restriction endonuclease